MNKEQTKMDNETWYEYLMDKNAMVFCYSEGKEVFTRLHNGMDC